MLARVVTNLASAGAGAIGVDVPLGQAGAPASGTAAGDALLAEATAQARAVVYPLALAPARAGGEPATNRREAHASWPPLPPGTWPEAAPLDRPLPALARHAKGVGHALTPADPDGVVRRLPVLVSLDGRAVPAFAVALAAAFLGADGDGVAIEDSALVLRPATDRRAPVRVPLDRHGRALVPFAGAGVPRGAMVVPFTRVWTWIEERRIETLEQLVDGRLVLILAEPSGDGPPTPLGPMPEPLIHAHLLDAALTGVTLREAPVAWALLGMLPATAFTAWLWLGLPWWAGLIGVVAVASAHAASVPLALTAAGLVLPTWPPIAALAIASGAALVWSHLASARRLRLLETENTRVRESLVRHESVVEALEEDLDASRAAVARSTGAERDLVRAAEALRAQLAGARAQEEETRRRLAELERELRGLRPVEPRPEVDGAEHERLRRECGEVGIVTRDPGVLALFRDFRKAARGSLPIVLLGEPGTGKELFARAAHRLSARGGAFVAVNMAAIPPQLFESELFGHVKGGFTGAVTDRKGYFAEADGGTIFLDEIGELGLEHQAKLLRVLQEKAFYRVGASRPTAVDVRVISASNRDVERGVAEGWFREDLYFRLKGLVLRLPPLRERPADVPLLAARVLADIAAEIGRPGVTLAEAAAAAIAEHDWPGNVRELQNVLRQAATLAEAPVIRAQDLRLPSKAAARGPERGAESAGDAAVLACLRQHRFDMQATGRALGWDRSTVTQCLKGLGFRALVESGGDRREAALVLARDPALARAVELKLREYHEHLLRSVEAFDSADTAVAACRRRFKNLPERHFKYLESLVRESFERRAR